MTTGLRVGDRVTFMRARTTARRIHCTTRYATVIKIVPAHMGGEVVQIKLLNGRTEWIHESEVCKEGVSLFPPHPFRPLRPFRPFFG